MSIGGTARMVNAIRAGIKPVPTKGIIIIIIARAGMTLNAPVKFMIMFEKFSFRAHKIPAGNEIINAKIREIKLSNKWILSSR